MKLATIAGTEQVRSEAERLRIVLLLEAAGGGAGRHVLDLARALVDRGHEVHLLYSRERAESPFLERLEALDGVSRIVIPMRRSPHPTDLVHMTAMRRYIRGLRGIDVLHGHSSKAGGLVRLAGLFRIPGVRIYTPHGMKTMDATLGGGRRRIWAAIERTLCRLGCQALIAVSDDELRHALSIGLPRSRIHVVVNGVSTMSEVSREQVRRRLSLTDEQVCIGFVGRFVPAKAPDRMLEAFAAIARRYPNSRLVMVGDGDLAAEVQATLHRLQLEGRVLLLPNESGEQVMPAFDVFVLPSRNEAMPYVLLEALATGLPIVSTDVGGASLAVDPEQNGFIVPNNGNRELVERIGILVESAELRSKMGAASRRRSTRFRLDKMVDDTIAVYRSAIHASGGRLRRSMRVSDRA